jgi:hypothetical protein
MKRFSDQTKMGTGHASAFFRQGLRELRSAFYPESNVAQQQSEYGLYGTRTPGEIAESRRFELEASQEGGPLGERFQSARRDSQESSRDAQDLERE